MEENTYSVCYVAEIAVELTHLKLHFKQLYKYQFVDFWQLHKMMSIYE